MRQLKIVQSITDRTGDSVHRYLLDISHIDLIQQEEEISLAKMVEAGDKVALDKLISTNLRFVVSVAKQYQNKGMSLSDLISEGNIGLIKAANRFDHTKGFKFISFAVYWIRQNIIQAIAEQRRLVRLPGNQINAMFNISKAALKLEQILERTPTPAELAEVLELPEEKIADTLSKGSSPVSLDASSNYDYEHCLLDVLPDGQAPCPERILMDDSLTMDLLRILNRLPEKQRIILKYAYGFDNYPLLTNEEIAYRIGLTTERVRQLRLKAITTLRTISSVNQLTDYLRGRS